MAKKKKGEEVKNEEKSATSEEEKPNEEEKSSGGTEADATKKEGAIYADSIKQSMYDELRTDGKTDTQARQVVALKSR